MADPTMGSKKFLLHSVVFAVCVLLCSVFVIRNTDFPLGKWVNPWILDWRRNSSTLYSYSKERSLWNFSFPINAEGEFYEESCFEDEKALDETELMDMGGDLEWTDQSSEDIEASQESSKGVHFSEIEPHNGSMEQIKTSNNFTHACNCNYYTGEWIQDTNLKPLYNYKNCTIYSSDWMCQKYPRPNFDFLKYKWKPEGCDLPSFDPDDFLIRTRNKIIGFIGDSLSQQHFKSLVCLLSANTLGSKRLKLGNVFGFYKPPGSKSPNGMAYKFLATNTTVLFIGNSLLCQTEIYKDNFGNYRTTIHLDKPDTVLSRQFSRLNIIILANTNRFYEISASKSSYDYILNFTKITDPSNITAYSATNMVIQETVKYLDSSLKRIKNSSRRPLVLFRTFSPTHYLRGTKVKGGSCSQYQEPLNDQGIQGKTSRDWMVENAVQNTLVTLMNITKMSLYRADAHPAGFYSNQSYAKQDCRHWCMPGVPDIWNNILYAHVIGKFSPHPCPNPPPASIPPPSPFPSSPPTPIPSPSQFPKPSVTPKGAPSPSQYPKPSVTPKPSVSIPSPLLPFAPKPSPSTYKVPPKPSPQITPPSSKPSPQTVPPTHPPNSKPSPQIVPNPKSVPTAHAIPPVLAQTPKSGPNSSKSKQK